MSQNTQEMSAASAAKPRQDNAFLNLLFNIVFPVLILNRLTHFLGPLNALLLALAFPLGYGAYEFITRRKFNAFSVLGLLNVSVTGGLALMGLHGLWFAFKEAAFPTLVGLFVFGSAFTQKPFIQSLFLNPTIMDVNLLEEKLRENNKQQEFHQHMRRATMWLSLSFVFSAICNFTIARRIFTNIDETLSSANQSTVLNEQIAKMTTWSMAIVLLPSMLFLLAIFAYLMKGVKDNTGLKTDELLLEK